MSMSNSSIMPCDNHCEEGSVFSKVVGVCDAVTNLCICPPGYDGKDDWINYNDCHINQQARKVIRSIVIGSKSLFAYAVTDL